MRRTVLAAALLPCALVLTSCSSSAKAPAGSSSVQTAANTAGGGSNAGLTEAQLTAKMKTALATATALHVKGTMSNSGQPVGMDMQLNKDGSAQGTVDAGGAAIPMLMVNGVTYIQFSSGYIQMLSKQSATVGQALAKYENKWVSSKSPTGASMTSGMDQFSFKSMTDEMISNSGQTYTYLDTGTLDGQQVAHYKDLDKQSGVATLSIPLTGPALPIQVDAGSQGTMTMVWNQPTTVTAPPASQIADITLPS